MPRRAMAGQAGDGRGWRWEVVRQWDVVIVVDLGGRSGLDRGWGGREGGAGEGGGGEGCDNFAPSISRCYNMQMHKSGGRRTIGSQRTRIRQTARCAAGREPAQSVLESLSRLTCSARTMLSMHEAREPPTASSARARAPLPQQRARVAGSASPAAALPARGAARVACSHCRQRVTIAKKRLQSLAPGEKLQD